MDLPEELSREISRIIVGSEGRPKLSVEQTFQSILNFRNLRLPLLYHLPGRDLLHCLVFVYQGHQNLLPVDVPLELLGVHHVDLLLQLPDDGPCVPAVVESDVGQVGVGVV